MIVPDILEDLERFAAAGAFRSPMLMLGAQEARITNHSTARGWFAQYVDEYQDLDLEDGDLKLDLNDDLGQIAGRYETVFNLGTIEHCWNVHNAWSNALRAVAPGGVFLSHSPVGGWQDNDGLVNHGLHTTIKGAIEGFVKLNGFEVMDAWVTRFRERGRIFWLRAEKRTHIQRIADYQPVTQVRGLMPTYKYNV